MDQKKILYEQRQQETNFKILATLGNLESNLVNIGQQHAQSQLRAQMEI